MKLLNAVQLRVFCRPETENLVKIRNALADLVPFGIKEEKLQMIARKARGFEDKAIAVFTLELVKQRHTNTFLKHLLNRLTKKQKEQLLRQKKSRLDRDFCFFIRFDKDKWLNKRELKITDSGRCFHIKMNLAVFPKKKEKALALAEKIFKPE